MIELKNQSTTDGSSATLTLQSGDTDIAQNDVLGTVAFQAPDEGTGSDAILQHAITYIEGDFSSSSNATSLQFKVGSSEAYGRENEISIYWKIRNKHYKSRCIIRCGGNYGREKELQELLQIFLVQILMVQF